jgi:GDSL-like Lipase/Acylhydrolase family
MRRLRLFPLPELTLALAAFVGAALAVEAYLRRFHPIDVAIYRLHPRYLHALVPGARKLYVHLPENGGRRILVTVDQAGFRGAELLSPQHGPRVVVYGDSFIEAETSPVAETYVARLEARLTEGLGRPVEAVNAGVAGYGPDQEALRIDDEIGPLKPDLLVMGVFAGNDFGDLMRDKLFRLGPDGRLAANGWTMSPVLRHQFEHAERVSRGSMVWHGLKNLFGPRPPSPRAPRHLLPAGGFPFLLEKRRHEYEQYVRRGDNEVRHLLGDPYDADVSLQPHSESARYKTTLMEKVLLHVAETARAHAVPLVFLFIPSAFDVCDHWEDRVDPDVFPDYRRDALTSALADIAARNGLEHLDLYPVFRSAGGDALYLRGDEHWNAAGEELAAARTTSLILRRGLLR